MREMIAEAEIFAENERFEREPCAPIPAFRNRAGLFQSAFFAA